MVFPRDIKTGAELSEKSFTEGGFWLDFAKTRYLDVSIKKEKLVDGNTGVAEDTRFNKPAKDGERFTEEGIYTITARNRYTDDTTTKTICVGKNDILKAYVVTGRSISEINELLEQGYRIADDGTFIEPPKPTATPTSTPTPTTIPTATPTFVNSPTVTSPAASEISSESEFEHDKNAVGNKKDSDDSMIWLIVISSVAALGVLVFVFAFARKSHHTNSENESGTSDLISNSEESIGEANEEDSTKNDKEGE